MNVAVACGGTGGHIFPGVATAEALRNRGHGVVLWLAGKDVERAAMGSWDGPVVTVPAEGFQSARPWRAAATTWHLLGAVRACKRSMGAARPDVLLGMGSYSTVGPAAAALQLRIPLLLHEANVVPGRAIRMFAGRAACVAASFEETRFHLRRHELVVTGMPLRRALLEGRSGPGATERSPRFTVLVSGGSRGAHGLNTRVTDALGRLRARHGALHVVHLTGPADREPVRAAYAAHALSCEVYGFRQDMASLYRRADLAVCRAGASTCAELLAFGVPSLLVPYPFATRNHQLANARAMEKVGAAHVVEERDLECDWLAEYITGALVSPARLHRMRQAALQRARTDAAAALADLVEKVARGRVGAAA